MQSSNTLYVAFLTTDLFEFSIAGNDDDAEACSKPCQTCKMEHFVKLFSQNAPS